uniref:Ubiquitin-conjugating enzyme E2 1-like n=1 Tax=Rhizophora mucronata TaxID=61149 RepID=A0A2P2M6V8_RHIMU
MPRCAFLAFYGQDLDNPCNFLFPTLHISNSHDTELFNSILCNVYVCMICPIKQLMRIANCKLQKQMDTLQQSCFVVNTAL